METVPLAVQTLYADLLQQVEMAGRDEATVVATIVGGIRYLRLQRWVGTSRIVEHLGRADDPEVQRRGDLARAGMRDRAQRRTLVSTLRRLLGGPGPELGKVLDVVAQAGLFQAGAVLVGTGAYTCYPALVGVRLPSSSLMTQDADLAILDLALAAGAGDVPIEAILQRADRSFSAVPGLDPGRPASRFRSHRGFFVDLLTQQRSRTDDDPVRLPRLRAGATPLQHLEWLVTEPASAVALNGAGIPVVVPQPARYAVHKLLVAQKRRPGELAKRTKDLMQAEALLTALRQSAPFDLEDALEDGCRQGRDGWARPIERSLKELGQPRRTA